MAFDGDSTSTLSTEVKIAYDKTFLKYGEYQLNLKEGAQMRTHSQNEGKTIWFNRYNVSDLETTPTALTEGVNPPVCNISAENVSVVLAEYGRSFKISKFLTLTSIDKNNQEKIRVVGTHMGQTLNRLVKNELANGTTLYAGGKAASTIASSNVFDGPEVRTIVETLETNLALPYEDGNFLGKVTSKIKTNLVKSTAWLNAKTYSDVKKLYLGEMGELYQVRFTLNRDPLAGVGTGAASTVAVHSAYIHGMDAFGCFDLAGDTPKLFILPNVIDSGNPTGRFSMASWAGSYGVKVLNPNWIIVSKSAI